MLGDATCWFKAEGLPDALNLDDAIKLILAMTQKDEWGHITVEYEGAEGFLGDTVVEYRYGEVKKWDDGLFNALNNRMVDKIHANGGWGMMSYYIKLKQEDVSREDALTTAGITENE